VDVFFFNPEFCSMIADGVFAGIAARIKINGDNAII